MVLEVASFGGTNQFILVGDFYVLSKGHSVPLVYMEGKMFPSIFWKDTIDSSLISAIPSSLLTDSQQCKKHGFASVTDRQELRTHH
jgi:hypothetical protein